VLRFFANSSHFTNGTYGSSSEFITKNLLQLFFIVFQSNELFVNVLFSSSNFGLFNDPLNQATKKAHFI